MAVTVPFSHVVDGLVCRDKINIIFLELTPDFAQHIRKTLIPGDAYKQYGYDPLSTRKYLAATKFNTKCICSSYHMIYSSAEAECGSSESFCFLGVFFQIYLTRFDKRIKFICLILGEGGVG